MDNNTNNEAQRGVIRGIFLVVGLMMLVGLPFFADYLPIFLFTAVMGILVVGTLAGLTTRRNTWVMAADTVVSLIGSFVFEFMAIEAYASNISTAYFIFNQLIAICFFFATYFSVRTFCGMCKK